MPQWIKSGSSWYVKHTKTNGSTTPTNNHDLLNRWVYCTVNGVASWRPIYNYRWALSDWSACSVTCGGGTKTKTFECIREDGSTGTTKHKDGTYTGSLVSNNYCTKSGLTTPSGSTISTSCNTSACQFKYIAVSDDYQTLYVKYNKSDAWTNLNIGQKDTGNPGSWSLNKPYGRYIYFKFVHWDGNGTSWHSKLKISIDNGSTYTDWIVYFPKNGGHGRDAWKNSKNYYWFYIDTTTKIFTPVACSLSSTNKASGCNTSNGSCCNTSGRYESGAWRYYRDGYMKQWIVDGKARGCGEGEPF